MKKNIVIGILLVLVIGLASYLGYDKFLKDEPTKTTEGNSTEESLPVEENDEKYSKSLIGKYIGQKQLSYGASGEDVDLNIEINILNENEMTITADDTHSEIETTKGTYTINENKLIYKRVYVKSSTNNWDSCIEENETVNCTSYQLPKTEEFTIDMTNKTLYSNNYNNRGPIILNYMK